MTHIANCMRLPEGRTDAFAGSEAQTAIRYPTGRDSPRLEKGSSRLGSPTSSRQAIYQLWPSSNRSPVDKVSVPSPYPTMNTDRAIALAVARSPTSLSDTIVTSGHNQPFWQAKSWGGDIYRRRKVSVPELSASMTTVQENALDSPTIPGRPPLYKSASTNFSTSHERCNSAPGTDWRRSPFSDALTSRVTGPATPAHVPVERIDFVLPQTTYAYATTSSSPLRQEKRPLTPILSPTLVKPTLKVDTNHLPPNDEEDMPPIPPPKSPSLLRKYSPGLNTPAMTVRSLPSSYMRQPNSAPASEGRRSPNFNNLPISSPHRIMASPAERITSPIVSTTSELSRVSHGRNMSEASVIDRGRPFKRPQHQRSRTCSEANKDDAAETWSLPQGIRVSEASMRLADDEKATLHKQSVDQAENFAILCRKDVSTLSRELRALDERCEYLRKTYKSLRDGRQKLHSRMISYLKRTEFVFSRESLLKQEEALAELDTSIDDWILKLEQAENRRLRLRQKLLEHVAAALLLDPNSNRPEQAPANTPPRSPIKTDSPQTTERKEVESIRIYADGRALDLFCDIEQAIGQMVCETC